MDKMRYRRIGCVFLAFLLLALCGCGLIRDTKASIDSATVEMDELLVQFMTCIENNDMEGAAALAYDGDALRRDFAALREYWPARSTDEYELKDLNVNRNIAGPEESNTTVRAVYLVKTGGEDYQVVLVKMRDANGDGLLSLKADRVQELMDHGEEPLTGHDPLPGKTLGQWCFVGLSVLCFLFCLFTVIDIIRKKPKLYGLWILIALVFFGGYLYRSAGGIQTGIRFGLLNASEWIRYYGGANRFQICLPFGAILYWCLRKNLLKQKIQYAVPADPPPPTP